MRRNKPQGGREIFPVSTFQKNWGLSRNDALDRIVGFIFLGGLIYLIIFLTIVWAPWFPKTESLTLLTKDPIIVSGLKEPQVQINDEKVFLKLTVTADQSLLAARSDSIRYQARVDGVLYGYDQPTRHDWRYSVSKTDVVITTGTIERKYEAKILPALLFFFLPIILVLLLVFGCLATITKKVDKKGYYFWNRLPHIPDPKEIKATT